jgi:ATP-dependent exoDNAse (exonuclease V) beta subunit
MSSRRAVDDEEPPDAKVPRPMSRRLPTGVAAVAGTAIHRLLETLPLGEDLAWAMAGARGALPAWIEQVMRDASLDESAFDEALGLAQSVHDAFVAGPAFAHFQSVARHVIARELPILAQMDAVDGLAALANGAIDLVYRDPATSELVVVDYKTGSDSETGGDRHRAQVEIYRRSLKDALALERLPRGELWYLASSRIVTVA